jgi:GTP-binding protein HflX
LEEAVGAAGAELRSAAGCCSGKDSSVLAVRIPQKPEAHPRSPESTLSQPTADNHLPTSKSRRAFLVGVILPERTAGGRTAGSLSRAIVEEHLDELAQLATTAGARVAGRAVQSRKALDPATFIGRGKAEEIAATAIAEGADLLVFDDDLSAGQVKALEEATGLAVLDRSGLILEIFDQRAQSREARTQVELARLNYLLPRLTRRWSHLSRQAGGVGTRGGEGEKQLEQDRRLLRQRIRRLEQDLARIERTRGVQRRGRRGAPIVALTGYTNAGKSTLFNRLTAAGTLAEDRLFATLDAKLRRGTLVPYGASKVSAAAAAGAAAGAGGNGAAAGGHGPGPSAVFADTVGFIRKLPHHLVSSFRSTLGEIAAADLVLHVVDRSHPQWHDQMRVADEVLDELGVERCRVITVFNKADRVPAPSRLPEPAAADARPAVWISAQTGEGLDALRVEIARRLRLVATAEPAGRTGTQRGRAAGRAKVDPAPADLFAAVLG